MTAAILWFRNDLRLHDNRVLRHAAAAAQSLLCLYIHDPLHDRPTAHGFPRMGPHRRRFLADTLRDLAATLAACGQRLHVLTGRPRELLPPLAAVLGTQRLFCEEIPAPEEEAEVAALRASGLDVHTSWQSSLLDPEDLPFVREDLPKIFTQFRKRVEAVGVTPRPSIPSPAELPGTPLIDSSRLDRSRFEFTLDSAAGADDPRSSFPHRSGEFAGGESAALLHLRRFFAGELAQNYKETRNGLQGTCYSTKFSPWLATGALSPRIVAEALREHEQRRGATESTYWIWFELLWRDYFRFLHRQHGRALYRASGLTRLPPPAHDVAAFDRWRSGTSGDAFIDAGMRELAATGYLSNRLRQNVASFLIHDLHCDFRAGAAWFESQLIDYDPCSNQGNWLYLAGRGTDPRGGRRFEPQVQARAYDPQAHYRGLWNRAD